MIDDVNQHDHLADHHTAVDVLHAVAYAGMPVAAEGEVLGALCVASPEATHDAVTGLPNRSLLIDRLTQALTRTRRTGAATAVFFADLDGFKPINDAFGHKVGDEVLAAIGQRLTHTMRASDTAMYAAKRAGGGRVVIAGAGDTQPAATAD